FLQLQSGAGNVASSGGNRVSVGLTGDAGRGGDSGKEVDSVTSLYAGRAELRTSPELGRTGLSRHRRSRSRTRSLRGFAHTIYPRCDSQTYQIWTRSLAGRTMGLLSGI